MKLPPGCEVITYQGDVFLTVTGGALGEATQQLTAYHARIIGRRLIEAADEIEGVEVETVGHGRTMGAE